MASSRSNAVTAFLELLSSMRFAISLLLVLAMAAVIGTVLKQGEPYPNYVIQLGQFWFSLFEPMGLFDVYHAPWFLVILGFLVVSTSLCLYRHTPQFLRDMRSFREQARETSLRAISHGASWSAETPIDERKKRLLPLLLGAGFKFRENPRDDGVLVAAKAGSANRWGYVFAHLGIVVICLGGLLDGDLPLKWMRLTGSVKVETRDVPQSQVPAESRLPAKNPSFRGNVTIPEGSEADIIFLNAGEGYLVQELPFSIAVDKFRVEYYSTGQPKVFASDVVVRDKATGETIKQTIEVNKPLIYKGIAVYQANFGDGGTKLDMAVWNFVAPRTTADELKGTVFAKQPVSFNGQPRTIEFTDFRAINVENFAPPDNETTTDARAVRSSGNTPSSPLKGFGGAAHDPDQAKHLRNVGPTFTYKLRDEQGQAREFHNYMLPIELDGRWYYLTGMRETPNEPFRYLRLPLAPEGLGGGIEPYFAWRAIMQDPSNHAEIARRFALRAATGSAIGETLRAKVAEGAQGVLAIFARGGFEAVAEFLTKSVPEEQREKVAEVYMKILDGTAEVALEMAQTKRGGPIPPAGDQAAAVFVRDALTSFNDSTFYGSPVWLQLRSFDEIKATGLQLARAPGQNIVYLGSLLLVLGVFAMFYLRERRVWLLLKQDETLFAYAATRKNLDSEREFARLKALIQAQVETKVN